MFKKQFRKRYKNLYRFLSYYKKHNTLIKILVTVMLLASSLGMLLPYFYSKRLVSVTNISFSLVLKYSLFIITIISFHHIFWYLWEKLASVLTNKVSFEIRSDIINKLLNIKYSELKKNTSGYYLERINDDTLEVSSFLSNVLGTIVDCLTNLSFLILIYILNIECGLIFTIGIILLYLVDSIKIKEDLKYTEKLKLLSETYNSKINENIKGIKDIKGLGIRNEISSATNLISFEISNIQIKKDKIIALLSRIKTFMQYLLECVLIVYSVGVLIPSGKISVVILIMVIDYSGFMYDLVGFVAKMKDYFVKGDFKAERLIEILDNKNIDEFSNNKTNLENYSIKVSNLSYSYEDDKKVKILDNISFSIKENTSNVFIGESGSGKSTLFGLLTKLLSPKNNKIFIGNIDINNINEEEFRKNICIINQEPFLFNDTLLNNIKIVKPSATTDEVINACKLANIYDEIMKLNKKFNTKIVENGNNLSGGQKQRIAIARAILKDSKILLFDEPTSALDLKNQKLFFDTIDNLKEEKTILIIAHKLNNLNIFNNVFELKNGKLKKI